MKKILMTVLATMLLVMGAAIVLMSASCADIGNIVDDFMGSRPQDPTQASGENDFSDEITGDGVVVTTKEDGFVIVTEPDITENLPGSGGGSDDEGNIGQSGSTTEAGSVDITEAPQNCSHQEGEWVVLKPATCTEKGIVHMLCTICGEELGRSELPSTGHMEVSDPAIKATCTSDGYTEGKHCSTCGKILLAQKKIPASGHTPGAEATCVSDKICLTCGAVIKKSSGHDWITATCTEPKHCSLCGLEQGSAFGHKQNAQGICERCGVDFSVDMMLRIGKPSSDQAGKGGFSWIFSPKDFFNYYYDELFAHFQAANISQRTIKYIYLEIELYNNVGDCIFTKKFKLTGPIAPGEDIIYDLDIGTNGTNQDFKYYMAVQDAKETVSAVKTSRVTIEYTDGSTETGRYEFTGQQCTTYDEYKKTRPDGI